MIQEQKLVLRLEQVLQEEAPRMRRILGRYRIPPQVAEELLLDVVTGTVRRLEEVEDPAAWLRVMLHQRCKRYWRRRAASPREPWIAASRPGGDPGEADPAQATAGELDVRRRAAALLGSLVALASHGKREAAAGAAHALERLLREIHPGWPSRSGRPRP